MAETTTTPEYREIIIPIGDPMTGRLIRLARINAEIIGPFAIHPSFVGLSESGYTLTHVGSGHAVETCLRSVDQAKRLAHDILTLGLEWDFTDPAVARHGYESVKALIHRHGAEADAAERSSDG